MRITRPIVAATIALGIAACATSGLPQVDTLYARHTMQAEVNPAIVRIWDIGNNAMTKSGGFDPAQMTPALWTELADAAGDLATAGERMAVASDIRAAAPSNMATEDYEVSMADVQRFIDADSQGFRNEAAEFSVHARALQAAALARDVGAAGDLVAGMDTACASCHNRYWYAEAE